MRISQRTFLIQLVILALVVNCHPERNEYYVEDKLLDCLYEQYLESEIDLKSKVDSASAALVRHKMLEGTDGRSYIAFIRKINAIEELPIRPSKELIAELGSIKLPFPNFVCGEGVFVRSDSTALAKSKFRYLAGIYDSIAVKGNISIKLISDEILEIFTARDFDHKLYGSLATMAIANMIMTGQWSDIPSTLPPPPEIDFSKQPNLRVLHLDLTSDDKINVNDRKVNLEKATQLVEQFILTHQHNHAISVTSKRSTSHRLFVSVVDGVIASTYTHIRDNYAMELYKRKYDELDEQSKEVVRQRYPSRVSISEPTRD
jgi:hypothetical protein